MKRTISTRALQVLLVSLFLVAPCQAEQKPEKLWKGMGPINDKYDWLRPPDSVFEAAVSRVHSGLATSDALMYEYQKRIEFDALSHVFSLWRDTPTTAAARVAQTDRLHFDEKPTVASVKAFRNYFYVMVVVQAFTRGDIPNLAITNRGKLIRPYQEDPTESKPARCIDYGNLGCWYNSRLNRFLLPEPERLPGPGSLILRWREVEKVVPINFDYLW